MAQTGPDKRIAGFQLLGINASLLHGAPHPVFTESWLKRMNSHFEKGWEGIFGFGSLKKKKPCISGPWLHKE
jgi:hypothetical protein